LAKPVPVAPLPVPKGTDRICTYCFGTGVYTRVRACRCLKHGWISGHEDGCDNGWLTITEWCDCNAVTP